MAAMENGLTTFPPIISYTDFMMWMQQILKKRINILCFNQSNATDINKIVNKLIKQKIEAEGQTVTWFAQQMHCERTNAYKIFQMPHMSTYQLMRISLILKHNFFSYYVAYIEREIKV